MIVKWFFLISYITPTNMMARHPSRVEFTSIYYFVKVKARKKLTITFVHEIRKFVTNEKKCSLIEVIKSLCQ